MIISTTLVGPGTVDLLDEALASVREHVDRCVVIATSDDVTEHDVKHAARRAKLTPGQLHFGRYPWGNDFADARNFALGLAATLAEHFGDGAPSSWAVTVDTDERLLFESLDLRAVLAETDVDLYLVAQADGSYSKERIFRLGKGFSWRGKTHEAMPWIEGTKRATLAGATFSELPKSAEQLRAKFERDAEILSGELIELADRPREQARTWYYFGESLSGLGQLEQATEAFLTCARQSGWDEEAAWSYYRAADLCCRLGKLERAVEHAGTGLIRHAGLAELGWIAGLASYRLGRFQQAVHWAMISISSGIFQGTLRGPQFARTGFRYMPALYEGPFDVLGHAYARLGDGEQAGRAFAKKTAAQALRERGGKR